MMKDKAVKLLKTIFHIGFCYFVAPISLTALFVFLSVYGEYPYVRIFTDVLIFSVITAPILLIIRKRYLAIKLSLYLFMLVLIPFLLFPLYFAFTPNFIGQRFAGHWLNIKASKNNNLNSSGGTLAMYSLGASQYEIIDEDDAVFFHPDPPVMLFISLKENNPHCMGYPQSAESACNRRLKEILTQRKTSDSQP